MCHFKLPSELVLVENEAAKLEVVETGVSELVLTGITVAVSLTLARIVESAYRKFYHNLTFNIHGMKVVIKIWEHE